MNGPNGYSTDPNRFDRRPRHSVSFENCTAVDGQGNETPLPDVVIYSDDPIRGADLMGFLGGNV